MAARHFGICAFGWLVSIGIIWSAYVYDISLVGAVLLTLIPWVLAALALLLSTHKSPAVQLDLTKIALQGGLQTQRFSAGDCVIRQGDEAKHFYIITSGRARVLMDDEYGSRTEVAELVVGQFFGEVGLLNNSVRMATVEAIEDLDVLVMDKTAFAGLVGHAGATAEHIRGVAEQRRAGTH